jgi:hypothetical protein
MKHWRSSANSNSAASADAAAAVLDQDAGTSIHAHGVACGKSYKDPVV